jgi:hypothetical protein
VQNSAISRVCSRKRRHKAAELFEPSFFANQNKQISNHRWGILEATAVLRRAHELNGPIRVRSTREFFLEVDQKSSFPTSSRFSARPAMDCIEGLRYLTHWNPLYLHLLSLVSILYNQLNSGSLAVAFHDPGRGFQLPLLSSSTIL